MGTMTRTEASLAFRSVLGSFTWRTLRKLGLAAAILACMEALFLISPRPTETYGGRVRVCRVCNWAHININCDSDEFCSLAENPRRLFTEEHRFRQSRPLYAVTGWLLAAPFRMLFPDKARGHLPDTIGPKPARVGHEVEEKGQTLAFLPEWIGYTLLNWILLTASVVVLCRLLVNGVVFDATTAFPIAVLASNEVSKVFFWTPHLQIFNIFVPVVSMGLFCWMRCHLPQPNLWHSASIGLLLGCAGLAYGAFAISAAGAVLCILFAEGWGAFTHRLRSKLICALILLAAFSLPIAIWVLCVRWQTGSFYCWETKGYHQFVWIFEALKRGPRSLVNTSLDNLKEYLDTLVPVVTLPLSALAALVFIQRASGLVCAPYSAREKACVLAAGLWMFCSVMFFALMGFYERRLSWSIVPALLLMVGIELKHLDLALVGMARTGFRTGIVSLAALDVIFWVSSTGPFY